MPLPSRYLEIPIMGLDERSDERSVKPGHLVIAENVQFDKDGAINKRRGYDRVAIVGEEVVGETVEETFHHCGTYRDELLIFGHNYLWALLDQAGRLTGGNTVVRRCKIPRCTLSVQDVASSQSLDRTFAAPPPP